ncbi:hypothetical protein [Photobacterium indicum]|uniref:hypothetical protein n=1 Tax=Photobacterium indicum TaxID=81447 RepID=UPI003D09B52C
MTAWWEYAVMIPAAIFGGVAMFLSVPMIIMTLIVGMGSFKHIIFIDKQLAKNLDKYYDERGYMRNQYQIWTFIQTRFIHYCVAYPFIRHRATSDSMKFKIFMWVNAVGWWGWIGVSVFGFLGKLLGIIP